MCTAWISWEKSFNLKLALEHCKFYAQVGLCQACLRHKNILMFMCVHTLSWPYHLTMAQGYQQRFLWEDNCLELEFLYKKNFSLKIETRQANSSSQPVPVAWWPPSAKSLFAATVFFVQTVPHCLIITLASWLHLKCCCWRLRECHFIYDNVIQILVYEKNWHTLTLFSWALIDA